MKDLLLDRLSLAAEQERSMVTIWFDQGEIRRMIELIGESLKPADKQNYEKAYMEGFEMGYQRALVDVIKKLKGMKWYGGDKQEERAAGVSEHYEE